MRRFVIFGLLAAVACEDRPKEVEATSADRPAGAAYVLSIDATVRARPVADADVVRTVAIGTELVVERVDGMWAALSDGYIPATDLAPEPVTVESLRREYFRADEDDAALRLRWVEREAALSPKSADVLERFVTTARQAEDEARTAMAARRLKAIHPKSYVLSGAAPPILVGTQNVLFEDVEMGVKLRVFGVGGKALGFAGADGRVNISFGKAPPTFLAVGGSTAKATESKRTPKRMSNARRFQLTNDVRERSGEPDSDHVVLSIGDRALAFFGAGDHLYAVDLTNDGDLIELAEAPLSALKAVADIGADGRIEAVVEAKGIVLYQLVDGRWDNVRRVL